MPEADPFPMTLGLFATISRLTTRHPLAIVLLVIAASRIIGLVKCGQILAKMKKKKAQNNTGRGKQAIMASNDFNNSIIHQENV